MNNEKLKIWLTFILSIYIILSITATIIMACITQTDAYIETKHIIEIGDELIQIYADARNITFSNSTDNKVKKIHYIYNCQDKFVYQHLDCKGRAHQNLTGKYCDDVLVCENLYEVIYVNPK